MLTTVLYQGRLSSRQSTIEFCGKDPIFDHYFNKCKNGLTVKHSRKLSKSWFRSDPDLSAQIRI